MKRTSPLSNPKKQDGPKSDKKSPPSLSLMINALRSSSSQLTVTAAIINQYRAFFANTRIIVLQHIKSDTEEFLRLLEIAGAEIFHIVAKPNSIVPQVLERMKRKYPLTLEEYSLLELSGVLDKMLSSAIEKSKVDLKRFLIVDVGGYFAKPVARLLAKNNWPLAGVVEVTTFGHNRYADELPTTQFPIYSVARSPIKQIEARFVGHAAANAIEQIMRDCGTILQGKQALINGFGMIGQSVAHALRSKGMAVSVYDKYDFPMLDASTQGYRVGTKNKLLAEAEFVFSATAQLNAITENDFDQLRTGTHLISVGSRTNEFDIQGLALHSDKKIRIADHIDAYYYKGKTINLVKDGKSINFLVGSCQDEVIDLLFAEIACCLAKLISNPPKLLGIMNSSTKKDIDEICGLWLQHRKNF
jgi:adenosylhomocysteinase